jgi:hypothetical protein
VTAENVEQVRHLKVLLIRNLTGCAQSFKSEVYGTLQDFTQQISAKEGQSINLSYWAFYWSFDLTFLLLFGRPHGYIASGEDLGGIISGFKSITNVAVLMGQVPEICSWTLANSRFMGFLHKMPFLFDPTQELVKVSSPIETERSSLTRLR